MRWTHQAQSELHSLKDLTLLLVPEADQGIC